MNPGQVVRGFLLYKAMKNKNIEVQQTSQSYIQPSRNTGQPAHVVQDGWVAYFTLPSYRHAHSANQSEGRGFFKGQNLNNHYGKKGSV
jgi:hypothetical protein